MDAPVQGLPALAPFGQIHVQGPVEGRGRAVNIVRVDDHGFDQVLGRAAELGQQQDAGVVGLGRNILLGDEIHAVAQGGDQTHIGLAVKRGQLFLGVGAVQVANRNPVVLRVAAVDFSDQTVNLALLGRVLRHPGARRSRDLGHGHLVAPRRVAFEQAVKGQQPLGDALGVVEPVNAEQDASAANHLAQFAGLQASKLRQMVRGRRILLGVDRLDYTKGISERLLAFDRLLERHPSWRDQVSMTQISAPSRTRVPEYAAQKREVDRLVGEINGRYSEDDWIPVRHLYRSYTQEELAAFYREADVCLVTPLRDGMNLVAKEYIAAQTDNPGVLLLSQFCGTAEDLVEAVIVNPYDIDGTASALNRALNMNLTERRERWQALNRRVHERTAQTWRDRFLADLEKSDQAVRPGSRPKARSTRAKTTGKTSA